MTWRAYEANPVIRSDTDDIVDVTWDGTERRYILTLKMYREHTWTGADDRERTLAIRLVGIAYSPDLISWTEPRVLFAPDRADPGVTEWYGSCCIQRRGQVLVGFLKVSRDDLAAPGNDDEDDFGYGYTTLLWSRDGTSWSRGRHTDAFLVPDPDPDAWDRSHAWIDSMVRVRDELFLYYGGYRSGHKGNRFSDRQLGVVKVPVDRFVALVAGDQRGRIVTRPFRFSGDELSLNATVPRRSSVDIRVLGSDANPIRGFDFRDCSDAAGDSVRKAVRCRGDLSSLTGTIVRLEALLPPRTRLFALNVCSSGDPRPCP